MTDDLVAQLSDHERIWLQNEDDAKNQCEGRLWCEDKVWPDDPEDGEPTEYIRADLHAAAEARVRELEDRVGVLEHDLDAQIAGHRLSANEATKHLMRIRELEAALAEVYERAAKEVETCWVTYTGRAGDDEREQIDRARLDIATAIRKLAHEVKYEAE